MYSFLAGPLDSDSEEELSEGEELRRAAAAAKATLPPKPPPDVIVISDSDSDVEESYRAPPSAPSRPLVPTRPAAVQLTQQQPSSTVGIHQCHSMHHASIMRHGLTMRLMCSKCVQFVRCRYSYVGSIGSECAQCM